MNYPNSKVAPHQVRRGVQDRSGRVLARDLDKNFEPNRQQRRDYVRHNQSRNNRLHLLGFGAWRRPRSTEESWAAQTAMFGVLAPRRERRPEMIRQEKIARWVRRQSYERRSLAMVLKSASRKIRGKLG